MTEEIKDGKEYAALVGLDWADREHAGYCNGVILVRVSADGWSRLRKLWRDG
jgi:hypothetical protein